MVLLAKKLSEEGKFKIHRVRIEKKRQFECEANDEAPIDRSWGLLFQTG